jgi:hypothetical protein
LHGTVLPITTLLQKETKWDWTPECQLAFGTLKSKFTEAPVLVMPDPTKPQKVKTDASDYAYGAILSQLEEDRKRHPVAYLSKSFSPAERNYDIYDKELKAIIGVLEAWQHYLEGATHTIEIWTDHKNLEYFKHAHKLSRRQAHWAQYLTQFDYNLVHKPGARNKADGLSWRVDHKEGVKDDNMDSIVLPPEKFSNPLRGLTMEDTRVTKSIRARLSTILKLKGNTEIKGKIRQSKDWDDKVIEAFNIIKENGPRLLLKGLQEWNLDNGLILFRDKIYVPKDNNLRQEVVQSCHNPVAMGHPG